MEVDSDTEWVLQKLEMGGTADDSSCTPPKWTFEKVDQKNGNGWEDTWTGGSGTGPALTGAIDPLTLRIEDINRWRTRRQKGTWIEITNNRCPERAEITATPLNGSVYDQECLTIIRTSSFHAIFTNEFEDPMGFVCYKDQFKKSYLVQPCAWTKEEVASLERWRDSESDDSYDESDHVLNWVVTRRKGLDVQIRKLTMSFALVHEGDNDDSYFTNHTDGSLPKLKKLYNTVVAKPADPKHVRRMPLFNAWRRSLLLENIVKPWFMALREEVEMRRARDPVKKLVAAALEVVKSQLVLGLEPADPVVGAKRKYE
tara:strand:- start:806 stop:1747 length:942 start_codon:yes stop_codon:yes gene_type:complete